MPIDPMSPLTADVDEILLQWPEVKARPVFGYRGYVRAGKMFAFLAGAGVAVKAAGTFGDELYARPGVVAFAYNGKPMIGWAIVPLPDESALDGVLDDARRAYDSVG
jgi:hypothetical protein